MAIHARGGVFCPQTLVARSRNREWGELCRGGGFPCVPVSLRACWHYLVATYEEDRHRDECWRHAHQRGLLEARAERPSVRARRGAASLNIVRRDHSLTDHRCRLRDGKIGRFAVVVEWHDGDVIWSSPTT